jgi:hypothetical protein
MTAGQRETITFRRKLVRSSTKGNEFLPAQGIGAGLGEGLGIVLNRVIRETSSDQSWVVRRVTGTVVEETAEYVTVVLGNKSSSGHRLKIQVSDIIRRKAI